MDEVSREFYNLRFENCFLRLKGNGFQDFFVDIMEKRYPGDFLHIKAGGTQGDHKADGYLTSTKTVYQAYGPEQWVTNTATKKIQDDFSGACGYWQDRMCGWIFVHNARSGLLPGIVDALHQLDSRNPNMAIGCWGYEELRRVILELAEADLSVLFGRVPTVRDVTMVPASDLKPIIAALAGDISTSEPDFRPVPSDKLAKNKLSLSVQILLKHGMVSASAVKRYFDRVTDPGLGDKIAARFKYRYGVLKGAALTPDEIFLGLREFAGGTDRMEPKVEAAVLAVLAYLFEQCDIFERPEGEVSS